MKKLGIAVLVLALSAAGCAKNNVPILTPTQQQKISAGLVTAANIIAKAQVIEKAAVSQGVISPSIDASFQADVAAVQKALGDVTLVAGDTQTKLLNQVEQALEDIAVKFANSTNPQLQQLASYFDEASKFLALLQ